jgi:hypothetical protein
LAKTESPALWQSRSKDQLFLVLPSVSLAPGPGPTIHCFTEVPDRNSFKGSASASIVALYRDAAATQPNVTQGVLEAIGAELRQRRPETEDPAPEHLAAYVYALLSTPAYQARFEEELEGKVVRVPLTAEPTLWEAAVALGSELIRLHTFGERFPDARTRSPRTQPSWDSGVTTLPDDHAEITYDEDRQQLRIGDGAVSHVPVEVWDYTVSGYPVVRRWLEHRTKRGRGRPTSELDDIRPTACNDSWNDELLDLLRALTASCELRPEQDELLARICDGPLIAGSSLPEPSEKERTVPPTERPKVQSDQLSADL